MPARMEAVLLMSFPFRYMIVPATTDMVPVLLLREETLREEAVRYSGLSPRDSL